MQTHGSFLVCASHSVGSCLPGKIQSSIISSGFCDDRLSCHGWQSGPKVVEMAQVFSVRRKPARGGVSASVYVGPRVIEQEDAYSDEQKTVQLYRMEYLLASAWNCLPAHPALPAYERLCTTVQAPRPTVKPEPTAPRIPAVRCLCEGKYCRYPIRSSVPGRRAHQRSRVRDRAHTELEPRWHRGPRCNRRP